MRRPVHEAQRQVDCLDVLGEGPTEMRRTPVSATSRTVANSTPPEASSSARSPAISTASRMRGS